MNLATRNVQHMRVNLTRNQHRVFVKNPFRGLKKEALETVASGAIKGSDSGILL